MFLRHIFDGILFDDDFLSNHLAANEIDEIDA